MDSRDQFWPQRSMNRTVPRQPVFAFEFLGPNAHIEMAFAAILIPGMAAMAFAVIHNQNFSTSEGGGQPVFDLLRFRHFFSEAPSISLHKV